MLSIKDFLDFGTKEGNSFKRTAGRAAPACVEFYTLPLNTRGTKTALLTQKSELMCVHIHFTNTWEHLLCAGIVLERGNNRDNRAHPGEPVQGSPSWGSPSRGARTGGACLLAAQQELRQSPAVCSNQGSWTVELDLKGADCHSCNLGQVTTLLMCTAETPEPLAEAASDELTHEKGACPGFPFRPCQHSRAHLRNHRTRETTQDPTRFPRARMCWLSRLVTSTKLTAPSPLEHPFPDHPLSTGPITGPGPSTRSPP